MATKIYLVKRYKRTKKANGRQACTWAMRWEDAGGFRCESTGTADKTQAQALANLRYAELNGTAEKRPEPLPPPPPRVKTTWREAREVIERAMRFDNSRDSYINDLLLMFDCLQKMFPGVASPADITKAQPSAATKEERRCSTG